MTMASQVSRRFQKHAFSLRSPSKSQTAGDQWKRSSAAGASAPQSGAGGADEWPGRKVDACLAGREEVVGFLG
jgi:hypothetical protein